MNEHQALSQRLQQLRGTGSAPDHLWHNIASAIEAPTELPQLPPTQNVPAKTGWFAWPQQVWANAAAVFLLVASTVLVWQLQPSGDAALHDVEEYGALAAHESRVLSIQQETAAIDMNYQAIAYQWRASQLGQQVLDSDTAEQPELQAEHIQARLLQPELAIIEQSRVQVRKALEQQPGSALLLRQLTNLDQWQSRLLRDLARPVASA